MPRVSVLIPATRPTYLGQTIASVLAQTLTDFEAIVADDSAAGDLEEVVARFDDSRLRYVRATGRSQPSTLTRLWPEASGPYLHIVHDDDFLLPFCLATTVGLLEAEPSASFAIVNSHRVSGTGERTGEITPIAPGRGGTAAGDIIVPRLLGRCHNFLDGVQAVTIRRAAAPAASVMTHFMEIPLRTLLDVALYLNALRVGPFVGRGEAHAAYREHAQQASSRTYNAEHASLVYEWELMVRGEIAAGRLGLEPASAAVEVLTRLYTAYLRHYPELELFLQGLPALKAKVAGGDTDVLDQSYREAWAAADKAVQARVDERAAERRRDSLPNRAPA